MERWDVLSDGNRRYSKGAVGMERIENMNLQWRYIAKVL